MINESMVLLPVFEVFEPSGFLCAVAMSVMLRSE
jgi:hypothetical protein